MPPLRRTDGPGRLARPLFLLNLKSYPNAIGRGADRFARLLVRAGTARRVGMALAAPPPELARLAAFRGLPIVAQHCDPDPPGAHTGAIVAEALRAAGVAGSLVNHSENPRPAKVVDETVARLHAVGLPAIVCAPDVRAAARLAASGPEFLAVEPPELIGGPVSVSSARPELIAGTVRAVHRRSPRTAVLCGAGIQDRHDVEVAFRLGAEGVLVASSVVKAAAPGRALAQLLEGFPGSVRGSAEDRSPT